jgi:tripartite-type tricarboxylate transporter receptor subunit TctC
MNTPTPGWAWLCGLALTAVTALPASAQSYPERTVKIVVAYPPSGATDLLARVIAPHLTKTWGVPVVVENRPGASGNIGMDLVAKSPPDGLTLAMTNNVVAINVSLFPNLPFDMVKDFEPLGLIGSTPMVLVVNPKLPAKTVAELTDYARKNPGKLTYASCGLGTPQHLAVELYRSLASIDMLHVPYKGCAPGVTDLIGGQVDLMAMTTSQSAPQIKSGMLRALAVTTTHRSAIMPDVPTFEQAGVPGYRLDIWFGLMAPAKTPAPILDKIHDEVKKFITLPETAERLRASGVEELVTSREEHAKVLKEDLDKYATLIRGLKLAPAN